MKNNSVLKDEQVKEICLKCVAALDDKKGIDIKVLDLTKVSTYLDYFIIVSSTSILHSVALSKAVEEVCLEYQVTPKFRPALDSGWILLDFYSFVVHIFTEEVRDFYQLEKLWGDSKILYPVPVK